MEIKHVFAGPVGVKFLNELGFYNKRSLEENEYY